MTDKDKDKPPIPAPLETRPSGSARWLTCTASPKLIAENQYRVDKTVRDYTHNGSLAHELGEETLKGDLVVFPEIDSDPDMEQNVLGYVDYCERKAIEMGKGALSPRIEESVPTFYDPHLKGTLDFNVYNPETNHLLIVDYKNGITLVDAEENTQQLIYAASKVQALHSEGYDQAGNSTLVTVVIYQPKAFRNRPEDVWEFELGDTLATRREMLKTHSAIHKGKDIKFEPSEKACQFCDAKAFCEARTAGMFEILPPIDEDTLPETLELPSFGTLSDEKLAVFLKFKKDFVKWIKEGEEHIQRMVLEEGRQVPGLKIVQGRGGNRKWRSGDEADKLLARHFKAEERRKKPEPLSPSLIETKIKQAKIEPSAKWWNRFNEVAVKSEGKPTVVPDDDKRPAIAPPVDAFEDLNEGDPLT